MNRNIVLTGLMGAGKSTVGQLLAQRLKFAYIDLDREIEQAAHKSVAEIFATDGEAVFRDLETQALRALGGIEQAVIASGGGAPLRPENRVLMREIGYIVWLDVDPQIAYARIKTSDRPLLKRDNPLACLQNLAAERQAAYSDCDWRIDANADPAQVIEAILKQHPRF